MRSTSVKMKPPKCLAVEQVLNFKQLKLEKLTLGLAFGRRMLFCSASSLTTPDRQWTCKSMVQKL